MRNIYFAAVLAALAFSACSNPDSDDNPSSSSETPSSSSATPSSSSSSLEPSSSSSLELSESGVCYIAFITPNTRDICAEGKIESLTPSDCEDLLEYIMDDSPEIEGKYTVEFRNSCPPGQKLKCYIEDEEDGGGYMYLYGSAFANATCKDIGYDDTNPSPSSASKPSSSSSAPSSSSSLALSSSSIGGSTAKSGACYFALSMTNVADICVESKVESITSSDCDETFEEMMEDDPEYAGMYTVSFRDSCPSGQKLKCEDEEGYVTYYYGSMITGMTCEDL